MSSVLPREASLKLAVVRSSPVTRHLMHVLADTHRCLVEIEREAIAEDRIEMQSKVTEIAFTRSVPFSCL